MTPMTPVEWTTCPARECGMLAEIRWRETLPSPEGFVELVRVRCVQRHWSMLPVQALAEAVAAITASAAPAPQDTTAGRDRRS